MIRSPSPSNGVLRSSRTISLFAKAKKNPRSRMASAARSLVIGVTSVVLGGGIIYILYRNDELQPLPATRLKSEIRVERLKFEAIGKRKDKTASINREYLSKLPFQQDKQTPEVLTDDSAWGSFTTKFALFSSLADVECATVSDKIRDFVLPEWAKLLPDYISKLQKELSMAPGSLADDIWQEARDPSINPEIEYSASVRISAELCNEEKDFRDQRKNYTRSGLAKYLDIPEEEVHPDDVPTIASTVPFSLRFFVLAFESHPLLPLGGASSSLPPELYRK